MITYVIVGFLILFLFLIVAGAISTTRILNRTRQMVCPECRALLTVPPQSPFRRWKSELGIGSHRPPGFTLHCDHCSADYRFTTDFQLVGRIPQEARNN